MKLEPLEFNALQVGLDHLLESLDDMNVAVNSGDEEMAIKIMATRQAKAKLDQLHKAIESEGGFSSVEIFINE
jgi:hypothetical protein